MRCELLVDSAFHALDHGVSVNVTVTLPVFVPAGSTSTVYVPVEGSDNGPKDPVLLHMLVDPSELIQLLSYPLLLAPDSRDR